MINIEHILALISFPILYRFGTVHNACKSLLHFLKVYGECREEDKKRYQHYKNSLDNAILIFNHPTFYDHIVVMKELGETFRFVMSHKYMFPPFSYIAANMNSIIVYPRNQTSQLIASGVQHRKRGDPLIAISPHGGEASADPLGIPKFRTGAFLAHPLVIPVVIKGLADWSYKFLCTWLETFLCFSSHGLGGLSSSMRVLSNLFCLNLL